MYQDYQSLLDGRSYNGKPHFWNPEEINYVPHSLIFDEDQECDPNWGVSEAIQRTLALGLHLEIPVGEWVQEGRKLESQLPSVALKLLQTNVADEAKHDLGFRYAAESYPIDPSIMDEAGDIAQDWLNSTEHTMVKARNAETGVFLAGGLAIMRLCGGVSLAKMAEQIARDEARHVSTNERVLGDLGINPGKPSSSILRLVQNTMDWLVGDLKIPGRFIGESYNFDKSFLMEASTSLVHTGEAPQLNSLLDIQCTQSPMEQSNSSLYQRSVA